MRNPVFTGSGVALVTPFHEDESVNYEVFAEIIEEQIAGGTDAIIICGTSGEAPTLSPEEHVEVVKFAVKQIAGRVPAIAGTGSNDTAFGIELSKEAEAAGADALLLVTPYYNRASQKGLIQHYTKIADSVHIPMILYNVPTRTGVDIKPETYCELSKHPNIVATKEANNNIAAIGTTFALCGEDFHVYSGNDDQITPLISLGGKGVISVLANIMPKTAHDIAAKALAGDFAGSAKLQLEYMKLINLLFSDVNPIPVKEAMNMMGKNVGPLRLPLCPMSDTAREALRAEMKAKGLL